jgi:hypothetical protein
VGACLQAADVRRCVPSRRLRNRKVVGANEEADLHRDGMK